MTGPPRRFGWAAIVANVSAAAVKRRPYTADERRPNGPLPRGIRNATVQRMVGARLERIRATVLRVRIPLPPPPYVIVFAGLYVSRGGFEIVPSFRRFGAGASGSAVNRDGFRTTAARQRAPLSLFAIVVVPARTATAAPIAAAARGISLPRGCSSGDERIAGSRAPHPGAGADPNRSGEAERPALLRPGEWQAGMGEQLLGSEIARMAAFEDRPGNVRGEIA